MQKRLHWFVPYKVIQFVSCYFLAVSSVSPSVICFRYSGNKQLKSAVPVTSLKVGDEVLLRIQGGARHTGIEIQEFIVEK